MTWPVTAGLLLAAGVALGGCASSGPQEADPELVAASEAELLAPYQEQRVIVCDRLEVDLSANFLAELALPSLPAESDLLTHQETEGGGSLRVYRAAQRPPFEPLRLRVGDTEFVVTRGARVEVLGGRAAYRLDVRATGRVEMVRGDERRALPDGFSVKAGEREGG